MIEVYDDFLPNFKEYKEEVKTLDFKPIFSQGRMYPNIATKEFPLKVITNYNIQDEISFVRLYDETHMNPSFIHTDISFKEFTGIFFIQSDKYFMDGGLAFWKHKAINDIELKKDDVCFDHKGYLVDSDTLTMEAWEIWKRVEFKENRLVIFPSSYFHSKCSFANHGKNIDEARIIQVLFFNKEKL